MSKSKRDDLLTLWVIFVVGHTGDLDEIFSQIIIENFNLVLSFC